MKYKLQRFKALLAAITLALLLTPVADVAATGSGTLSLVPVNGSIGVGADATINIVMDTAGTGIFAWRANINYPTAYFSSASISVPGGSPFSGNPGGDIASGGKVSLSRYYS